MNKQDSSAIIPSKGLQLISTEHGLYAYNKILGGFRRLNNGEHKFLLEIMESTDITYFNKSKITTQLLKDHFIQFLNDPDEYEIIQPALDRYYKDIKEGKTITKLLLVVTEDCMLRCSYCYLPDSPGSNVLQEDSNTVLSKKSHKCTPSTTKRDIPRRMNWDTAKIAIDEFDKVVRQNQQKRVHIRFHGGEPLLCWSLIQQAIEYAEEKLKGLDVIYHMNTTGIGLTKQAANFMASKKMDLEISLDGPKDIHDSVRKYPNGSGSFDQGIKACNLLLQAGLSANEVNIACTLHQANASKLRELVDLTVSLGLNELEINVFYFKHDFDILDDIDRRVDVLVDARVYGKTKGVSVQGKWFKLLSRLKDPVLNYCGRFGQQLGFDPAGNVLACTAHLIPLGHISKINELLVSNNYRYAANRTIGQIDDCTNCEIEGMCAGGCQAAADKEHGSFYKADRKECEFRKKMILQLIKRLPEIVGDGFEMESVDPSYFPRYNDYTE